MIGEPNIRTFHGMDQSIRDEMCVCHFDSRVPQHFTIAHHCQTMQRESRIYSIDFNYFIFGAGKIDSIFFWTQLSSVQLAKRVADRDHKIAHIREEYKLLCVVLRWCVGRKNVKMSTDNSRSEHRRASIEYMRHSAGSAHDVCNSNVARNASPNRRRKHIFLSHWRLWFAMLLSIQIINTWLVHVQNLAYRDPS